MTVSGSPRVLPAAGPSRVVCVARTRRMGAHTARVPTSAPSRAERTRAAVPRRDTRLLREEFLAYGGGTVVSAFTFAMLVSLKRLLDESP
jgi:hypothetical protein